MAISIKTPSHSAVDIISVYAPKGENILQEEISSLFSRPNPFIIGGDFNAHHSYWESNAVLNRGGNEIWNTLCEVDNALLVTPRDLGTRIDPSSGKTSTIDLLFASPTIAFDLKVSLGPNIGSDHRPVRSTFNEPAIPHYNRPTRWLLDKERWPIWNNKPTELLIGSNFFSNYSTESLFSTFNNSIQACNNIFFKKSSSSAPTKNENCRPWWSKECSAAVNASRKAYREWCKSPSVPEKRKVESNRGDQTKNNN